MSTETNVIETTLQGILDAHGGSYVAAYEAIVAQEQAKALQRVKMGSNVETRKAAWRKAVRVRDRKALADIRKLLKVYVSLAIHNAEISSQDPHVFDMDEARLMIIEAQHNKRAAEFFKARLDEIRAQVYNSMNLQFADAEFPEQEPGSIEVPELGLKFTREGGNRKEPELDESALRAAIGEADWKSVSTTEVVVVERLDMDAFMKAAARKPSLLEHLRDSLKVGKFNTPSFHVRPINPEE